MGYNSGQPRDDHGRFASGGGGQRLTRAAAERAALNRAHDQTRYHLSEGGARRSSAPVTAMDKIMSGLRQQYGARAPSEDRVREIMATGAHSLGIHSIPRRMT